MRALAALFTAILLAGCRPSIPPVGPVSGPDVPVVRLQDKEMRGGAAAR